MFEGHFSESKDQTATLEQIEGVLSVRSFEAFLQWLYLRRVKFSTEDPIDRISAVIEFTRLADMYSVSGMESQMADEIKEVLVANPGPQSKWGGSVDINTHHLTPKHLTEAACLPCGHPVRQILAAASVEGYLTSSSYKFVKQSKELPSFGADLLQEVRAVLNMIKFVQYDATITDPIRQTTINLNSVYRK